MDYKTRQSLTKKRYRADKRFRLYSIASCAVALSFLVILVAGILYKGIPAFSIREIRLNYNANSTYLPIENKPWNYELFLNESLAYTFPDASLNDLSLLKQFIDLGARRIAFEELAKAKQKKTKNPSLWLPSSDLYHITWSSFEALPESLKNKSYRRHE
ncbi:MAG: DUF3333 domain-containing protein, partial [Candidatus Nucleicultricaceae bacterium]